MRRFRGIQTGLFLFFFVIVSFIGIIAIPSTDAATSITLNPIADTYVNSSSPSQNYGTQQYILSDKNKISYLKYDLTSQAGKQLVNAKLRLFVADSSSASFNLKNVSNTSWSESSVTYNTRPALGSAFATFSNPFRGTWKEVDVTSYVQSRLGQVVSIAVDNSSGNADSVYSNSRENASNKPQLVLQVNTPTPTNVPTPTAVPSPTPTAIPTLTPLPTVTPTPTSTQPIYPAQILNLTNWKETLPTGIQGSPTEIKQPALATYSNDPWFKVAPSGNAVQFRAPVNGATTSGSNYPRSELREMTNNGTTQAAWSSSTGTHTMFLDEAVTALPATKNQIVIGQIHDASSDILVIRLQGPKLFIKTGDVTGPTLDANYTLGKRFTVKVVVSSDQTNVYYNGSITPVYTFNQVITNAYFKAGAYTQSNCTTEAANLCTADNYGEAYIYNLQVTHE